MYDICTYYHISDYKNGTFKCFIKYVKTWSIQSYISIVKKLKKRIQKIM